MLAYAVLSRSDGSRLFRREQGANHDVVAASLRTGHLGPQRALGSIGTPTGWALGLDRRWEKHVVRMGLHLRRFAGSGRKPGGQPRSSRAWGSLARVQRTVSCPRAEGTEVSDERGCARETWSDPERARGPKGLPGW